MAITEERVSEHAPRTSEGRVLTITGPVIDAEFPPDALPEIGFAIQVDRTAGGETDTITAEVSQHIGEKTIKAICMKQTDGLGRGPIVRRTGASITAPT